MKVAISDDFLLAFSNVQKTHQKKVREFIELFRENPEAGGIQYHPVRKARDPNLYSVRIDQAYRAIVLHPADSDIYLLTWVDHHDDAYAWAERKVFRVNPMTGALQVLAADVVEAAETATKAAAPVKKVGLFRRVKDDVLLRFGVPVELVPTVRAIEDEDGLEENRETLPQEAWEALYLLAAGYDAESVSRELEKPAEPVAADPTDFAAALANDDSKRRFVVVSDAKELAELLNAPLDLWRVFLHPKQRKLVSVAANGPYRVLGGAGTGKTVVAMHRAKHLVETVFPGRTDRVLFTTFTRNLATDIHENLKTLCGPDLLSRIEVVNLDAWVSNFLKGRGYKFEPVFDDENNELWENALALAPPETGLSREFYRQEWDEVIQPQGVDTLAEYLRAPRLGRGTKISRAAREAAWPVFREYRSQLTERGKREYIDMVRDARQLIEKQGVRLPYKAVVVDEAQDMSAEAFRLIRAIVEAGPNDLFIVGDAHQRIYRHRATLGKCGIDIRGRARKLRLNYRTTDEIRRFAVALLEGRDIDDLDGGLDDQQGYMSLTHGPKVDVHRLKTLADETAFLGRHVKELVAAGATPESICIVGRTKNVVEHVKDALRAASLDLYEVKREATDNRARPGVRVATMHRVKGLEFDHVVVASVNDRIIPLEKALRAGADQVAVRNAETAERALFYVALTRAKKSAVVSGYGAMSPFLS
jgi:superfamily I DNA/RNA helicase/mRNA-degrading endonuclease RelE of RelBE toxin-antitoxin system